MKSPKPPKAEYKNLTFMEAVEQILMGKSVTKKEWGNVQIFGILDQEKLKLHKADNKLYDWIVSEGDMRGDDFYVL